MKKVIFFTLVTLFVLFSGCSSKNAESVSANTEDISTKPIEVKNGFIDISVEDVENNFNSQLSYEYEEANLQSFGVSGEYSYHFCNLGDGIDLTVSASPDETMTSAALLTLDMTADYDANKLGYYYAKLIYTFAPDITSDEIISISEEIDMANPLPGDLDTTIRNNIIYAQQVEEEKITLSIIAKKP